MHVSSETPPENDDGRGSSLITDLPWLRRTLVFLLLGPILGVLIAFSMIAVATGGYGDPYGVPIVFFFTLILCAITGPVDGLLTYIAPVWLRVPLTTSVGAAVSVGVAVELRLYISSQLGKSMVLPPLHQMIPIAVFGALCTGVCSLLSHNYRRAKA
jgi:hypothetical protein